MSHQRTPHPSVSFPWRFVLSAALAILLLLVGPAAFTDDTQLLRFDTAKPYVFIVLDTSASMGLAFDNSANLWTPAGADGPGSRLYQAKQALYNTFTAVNDVHFGFASYNQDQVRALEKHYLYYHNQTLDSSSWPIPFPLPDRDDGLTRLIGIPRVDKDGNPAPVLDVDGNPVPPPEDTRVLDVEGHLLTFGKAFGGLREAGSCASPINYTTATGLRRLQSFAIDGATPSGVPTRLWLTNGASGNNLRRYLLTVERPGSTTDSDGNVKPNKLIGQDEMLIKLQLYEVSACPFTIPAAPDRNLNLQMQLDPFLGETFFIDGDIGDDAGDKDLEITAGLWDHQDAISEADFDDHPFTGEGWESNYDSGGEVVGDSEFQASLDANQRDRFCGQAGVTDPALCAAAYASMVRPSAETIFDSVDRHALDIGDMIPFHWTLDRLGWLKTKLAPNWTIAPTEPDFRGASYFGNAPLVADQPLQLSDPNRRPLLALDQSPLARAINDVRCWYLGTRGKGTNKCKADNPLVEVGWEELACEFDSRFGCRKPYLILITDGEDNIKGENPTADVSDLFGASGMRTWILNLGDPGNCSHGLLNSIINAGGQGKSQTGECINVQNGSQLRQELEAILGQIRTETRAFASAAVPTVQATVDQKIFLTNFTPFNDSGVWDGHVQSFLKPLPVDETTGKPDTGKPCGPGRRNECYLWDTGVNMLTVQYKVDDATLPASQQVPLLDVNENQRGLRRVYYAERAEESGRWAAQRHLFQQAALVTATQQQRFDLWDGFGIGYTAAEPDPPADPHVNQAAADASGEVIDFVLRKKSGTVKDPVDPADDTVVEFLLGDIFHATPQVVGTPANVFYFASDYPLMGATGGECAADPDDNENLGYRCFFERQRLRRKMLLVGSNDGQLHVLDAGRFRGHDDDGAEDHFTQVPLACDMEDTLAPSNPCFGRNPTPFGSFDNGTGLELFSYVPRAVLPTLNEQKTSPTKHFFTVDGNVTVADVFIDPVRDTPGATFPNPAQREWRTVAIGSLREGGVGYYALDLTEPDPVEANDDLGFVPLVASPAGNDPATANYLPQCLKPGTAGCGPVPFPATVWEFTDSFFDEATGKWYLVDEDLAWMEDADSPFEGTVPDPTDPDVFEPSHGVHDLGDSWSTANVGLIRVCRVGGSLCEPGGEHVEDRFVAIFGGGMDVDSKTTPLDETRGNWLYMVDIETGETIYKQRLDGAAPSEPAAVDTNGDSLIDRIYIGTLAGYLYRVDVGTVAGSYPALEPTRIQGVAADGARLTVDRDRIPRDMWIPVKLFDTNFDLVPGEGDADDQVVGSVGHRPIYYRPSVIFRAGSQDYALAFGTGDREDLWSLSSASEPLTGRFYVFVDEHASTADITVPLDEGDLTRIDVATTPVEQGGDLLATGGWFLVLAKDERVITEAFALSGITVFSAYEPKIYVGEDDSEGQDVGDDPNQTPETDRACGDQTAKVGDNNVCSLRGVSNIYVVNTTNADGLLFVAGARARAKVVADFVTNPFTEPGQTKTSGDGDGEDDGSTADELTPDLIEVMESLKALFPPQCKFANYRVDIKTIAADTSLQFIAPVPVCIIEHNWKEY